MKNKKSLIKTLALSLALLAPSVLFPAHSAYAEGISGDDLDVNNEWNMDDNSENTTEYTSNYGSYNRAYYRASTSLGDINITASFEQVGKCSRSRYIIFIK